MTLWKIAWRNLWRQRRRNQVTFMAIAFGFAGVSLLGGYMLRMESYLATQAIYLYHAGHLSVYNSQGLERSLVDPKKADLSREDQRNILGAVSELSPKPEFIGEYLKGQGLVTNGCQAFPFLVTASDPESESRVWSHPQVLRLIPELAQLRRGRGFWDREAAPDSILVSPRLAHLLNKPRVSGDPSENKSAPKSDKDSTQENEMNAIIQNCQDPASARQIASHAGVQLYGTTFDHGVAAVDARISGHFVTGLELTEDTAMIAPLKLIQQLFATESVTWIAVYLDPRANVADAVSELQKKFAAHGWGYRVYPYYDERVSPFYVGAMSFVDMMTLFFLVLICGVVSLSVLNALQSAFIERRSEVGMLRAMGFRTGAVAGLFARETALLSAMALLTGAALAALIASLINASHLRFSIPGASGTLQFMLKPGFWFCLGVGIFLFALALGVTFWACSRWSDRVIASLLESK